MIDHVHLEQAFNAVQAFEDEFVSSVELDTGLPIDAFGAQFLQPPASVTSAEPK